MEVRFSDIRVRLHPCLVFSLIGHLSFNGPPFSFDRPLKPGEAALVVAHEDVEQPWSMFQIQIKTEEDELWWYEKKALRPSQPRLLAYLSSLTCVRNNKVFPPLVCAEYNAASVSCVCGHLLSHVCAPSIYAVCVHSITLCHNSVKERFRREKERFEREIAQRELDEIQVEDIMVPQGLGREHVSG